jgi:hypothetical protein
MLRAHFGLMNMAAARHIDTVKLHLCDMTEPSLVLLCGTAAIAGVRDCGVPPKQFPAAGGQGRRGKYESVTRKLYLCCGEGLQYNLEN